MKYVVKFGNSDMVVCSGSCLICENAKHLKFDSQRKLCGVGCVYKKDIVDKCEHFVLKKDIVKI